MCYLPDLGNKKKLKGQNCYIANFKENDSEKLGDKEELKRARFASFNGPEYKTYQADSKKNLGSEGALAIAIAKRSFDTRV